MSAGIIFAVLALKRRRTGLGLQAVASVHDAGEDGDDVRVLLVQAEGRRRGTRRVDVHLGHD